MVFEREYFIKELRAAEEYFNRSTKLLTEEQSSLLPAKEMYTAAQQIGHVGLTIHWFLEGAFSDKGFNLDMDEHKKEVEKFRSISEARVFTKEAFRLLGNKIQNTPEAEWTAAIVPGPVMGGEPRYHILPGIVEHTAHHRGALTVYARIAGIVPPMPYMDM